MVCIGGNYDAVGHQTAFPLTLNGRSDRTISTEYDHLGNATSIRQHGNAVDEIFAEFEHNANGLLTSVRRYEKDDDTINEIANSLYEYNANSAVTSITHNDSNGSQIVKHSYTYDETNNIVEYLNSIDGNTEYNYDFLGQLISADYANGSIADETYTYDENGNRITANGSNYTTGDNNELTSDGTWTYTYDAEGNRISKTNAANTERELYTWDYRNRLTTVTKQTYDTLTNEWTTVQIVEYAYDYNNIWIRKTLDTNGDGIADSKTIFIPENYQTTVQLDDTDLTDATGPVVTHHYLWNHQIQDQFLADSSTSAILWSFTDNLDSICDVIQKTLTGNIVLQAHIIYDAYGNIISCKNSAGQTIDNPILFGYVGKIFDHVTLLQNNINRWYDATIGRWLKIDPTEFSGNTVNLYCYVDNNPITYIDLDGLNKRRKPMDPHQAGIHGQGRPGQTKARRDPNWKPHNNTPPRTPPKHTPGRDHRKHPPKMKRKGSVNIKVITGLALTSSEIACATIYNDCLKKANSNYEANLKAAYMMADTNLRDNSIQLANRILALDLAGCAASYAACGLSCLLPFDILQ